MTSTAKTADQLPAKRIVGFSALANRFSSKAVVLDYSRSPAWRLSGRNVATSVAAGRTALAQGG